MTCFTTVKAAQAGNTNCDLVVPAGDVWRVNNGLIRVTTDATVANRQVSLSVYDAQSNLVFCSHAGATIPASQTDVHLEVMQGIYRETTIVAGALQMPVGRDLYLLPGHTLRVFITNGVAGDSFSVAMSFCK